MIKRRLGYALRARRYWSQCREILLKALTHNVMIVRLRVFYRAAFSRVSSQVLRRWAFTALRVAPPLSRITTSMLPRSNADARPSYPGLAGARPATSRGIGANIQQERSFRTRQLTTAR